MENNTPVDQNGTPASSEEAAVAAAPIISKKEKFVK